MNTLLVLKIINKFLESLSIALHVLSTGTEVCSSGCPVFKSCTYILTLTLLYSNQNTDHKFLVSLAI